MLTVLRIKTVWKWFYWEINLNKYKLIGICGLRDLKIPVGSQNIARRIYVSIKKQLMFWMIQSLRIHGYTWCVSVWLRTLYFKEYKSFTYWRINLIKFLVFCYRIIYFLLHVRYVLLIGAIIWSLPSNLNTTRCWQSC